MKNRLIRLQDLGKISQEQESILTILNEETNRAGHGTRWNSEEINKLEEGLYMHGKNYAQLRVSTKSRQQIRDKISHQIKMLKKEPGLCSSYKLDLLE